MGGYVGQALKSAGYDGLLIKGKSEAPVYLHVRAGEVALRDASSLWGHDTYETESLLKEWHGNQCQVASIGPAGENLVGFASLNHRGHNSAARCGMGAVLGSKQLKALAVEGEGLVEVADPDSLKELRRSLTAAYKDSWWVKIIRSGGTAWGLGVAMGMNDVPVKNYSLPSEAWKEQSEKVSGQAMEEAGIVTGRETCFRCPIACRRLVRVDDGPWPVAESAGPEYESQAGFCSMLMLDDPRALCKINELCNRYGILQDQRAVQPVRDGYP
jgi:aldehyde:ferredoxin oxidoreductase